MTEPGTERGNNPGSQPGGVAGGFWGSLLAQDGHPTIPTQQKQLISEQNSYRNSQSPRVSDKPEDFTKHGDYDDYGDYVDDYDYTVEDGELFIPQESQADHVLKSHQ